MDEALAHFDQISAFGRSAAAMLAILAADLAITALHSYQEWRGPGAPLWRNFGAIVGLAIPDTAGFLVFTVGLTLLLWAIAVFGITGGLPLGGSAGACATAAALGGLIGARLSDTVVSHVLPHIAGYRPNPGLASTPLFVVEALFISFAFRAGLAAAPACAAIGFGVGVVAFITVLPGLRLVGRLVPAWRRDPWQRGQPVPGWAAANT